MRKLVRQTGIDPEFRECGVLEVDFRRRSALGRSRKRSRSAPRALDGRALRRLEPALSERLVSGVLHRGRRASGSAAPASRAPHRGEPGRRRLPHGGVRASRRRRGRASRRHRARRRRGGPGAARRRRRRKLDDARRGHRPSRRRRDSGARADRRDRDGRAAAQPRRVRAPRVPRTARRRSRARRLDARVRGVPPRGHRGRRARLARCRASARAGARERRVPLELVEFPPVHEKRTPLDRRFGRARSRARDGSLPKRHPARARDGSDRGRGRAWRALSAAARGVSAERARSSQSIARGRIARGAESRCSRLRQRNESPGHPGRRGER